MSSLGQYLRSAREARGIDVRDAAQQTRISIHYLNALETEDFSRLPGEVFVRGFLKSYAKFLRLDESEVMIKYGELRRPQPLPAAAPETEPMAAVVYESKTTHRTPLEPFIWGAGLVIALVVFLVTALPGRPGRDSHRVVTPSPDGRLESAPAAETKSDKLYLEVFALDNTWVLVRTDDSPQKKAVLKKGESLIWSANERFEISYGAADALKLQLNGQELTVNEPKNAVVRDLTITASGILNRKIQPETARPAKQPLVQLKTQPSNTAPGTFNRKTPSEAVRPARQPLTQVKTQPSNTTPQPATVQDFPHPPQPAQGKPASAPRASLPWETQQTPTQ